MIIWREWKKKPSLVTYDLVASLRGFPIYPLFFFTTLVFLLPTVPKLIVTGSRLEGEKQVEGLLGSRQGPKFSLGLNLHEHSEESGRSQPSGASADGLCTHRHHSGSVDRIPPF